MAMTRINDDLYARIALHVDGVRIKSIRQFIEIAVEKALAEAAMKGEDA